MSLPQGLDPDLLRAFAFIAEEGSFTRAAERVGRTQSAVSMQVQRLEAMLGQRVLLRGKGGAVSLTPHGHYLLERAREMLAVNDEIWATFRAPQVQGTVRLGTPDDYALRYLPQVLKRFADTHPSVEVDVLCAPSDDLAVRLKAGELDLTLRHRGQRAEGLAIDRAVARPAALDHLGSGTRRTGWTRCRWRWRSRRCTWRGRRWWRWSGPASAIAWPTPRPPWRARRRR